MADFIITSLQSWDIEIGSTIKNTASEIAKKHRVLYVNPPMDIDTRKSMGIGLPLHHTLRMTTSYMAIQLSQSPELQKDWQLDSTTSRCSWFQRLYAFD